MTTKVKTKIEKQTKKLAAYELFPQNEIDVKILQERAARLAKQQIVTNPVEEDNNFYIHVSLNNGEYYGIPYHYAKEVIALKSITKIPFVPNYIAGIINWRGSLLTVINLAKRFNSNENTDGNKECSLMIIEAAQITVGILVGKVIGNKKFNKSKLGAPLSISEGTKLDYVMGLDSGGISILNFDAILSDIKDEVGKLT